MSGGYGIQIEDRENSAGAEIIDDVPVCECPHSHSEKEVMEGVKIPDDGELLALSEFYKVFGEVSRLKILYLLSSGEHCVCDIASAFGFTVSAVSHQLKILKNARLVKFRKDGKNCLYSLADNHILSILFQGMEHIEE